MDQRPGRRTAPRWPTTLDATPLCVQEEPVALVVSVDSQPHAWDRRHAQIRPLPTFDRQVPPSTREVLVAGGHHLIFAREGWIDDESVPYLERRTALGVYRYCFATGALDRATFEPPPGAMHATRFAASPDGV